MLSRLCAALLAALIAATAAHAAEPALESVAVDARAESGRSLTISMSYFLLPAGAPEVGFTALRFGESRTANVRAFLNGDQVSFFTEPGSPSRVDGRVELPASSSTAERIHLRLVYEVLPAPGLTTDPLALVLPLLVCGWPPLETRPETFVATVHLPEGTVVLDAFPTSFARVEPIEKTSGAAVYRFELPVVPALLRLRAAGKPRLLTPERWADVIAVGLLASLAWIGWRRLRETLA